MQPTFGKQLRVASLLDSKDDRFTLMLSVFRSSATQLKAKTQRVDEMASNSDSEVFSQKSNKSLPSSTKVRNHFRSDVN